MPGVRAARKMTSTRNFAPATLLAITIFSATGSAALGQSQQQFLDLQHRIERLEGRTLSRTVGRAVARAAPGQTGGAVADLSQRLAELEDTVRRLNGRIEILQQRLGVAPGATRPQARAAPVPGPAPRPVGGPRPAGGPRPIGAPRVLAPPAPAPAPVASAPTAPLVNQGVRVLGQIPSQSLSRDLRGGVTVAAPAPDPDRPLEKYSAAYGLILRQDYRAATQAFTGFLDEYPRHDLSANAQYWLAESYFVRGRNPQAAREFLKSYKNFPNSSKAPDSLLKLGMALAALGEKTQACAAFREYAGKFAAESRASGDPVGVEMRNAGC